MKSCFQESSKRVSAIFFIRPAYFSRPLYVSAFEPNIPVFFSFQTQEPEAAYRRLCKKRKENIKKLLLDFVNKSL